MTRQSYPDALPAGHLLHWMGAGARRACSGQGARHHLPRHRPTNLIFRVAIKNNLPTVDSLGAAPTPRPAAHRSHSERYAWASSASVGGRHVLARFDHPSVVRVYSFF